MWEIVLSIPGTGWPTMTGAPGGAGPAEYTMLTLGAGLEAAGTVPG